MQITEKLNESTWEKEGYQWKGRMEIQEQVTENKCYQSTKDACVMYHNDIFMFIPTF